MSPPPPRSPDLLFPPVFAITVNDGLLFYEEGELLNPGFKFQLCCGLAV